MLIGFRSSHNFLEKMVTKQWGCIKESICALNVAAANGNQLMFDEIFRKLQWGMQGYQFQADFFILPLDNYDMILGIQWLAELGDIFWNFK